MVRARENRSLDPWGHMVGEIYAEEIAGGLDIRPTIAITKARLNMPEILGAMSAKRLKADGTVLHQSGDISVTKVAVDPLVSAGRRRPIGTSEGEFRRTCSSRRAACFPGLVTRPDMNVFLPPIGNITVYIMGDVAGLGDDKRRIACRVHDECNGSDVFGSDICTCRPYLVHGVGIGTRHRMAASA